MHAGRCMCPMAHEVGAGFCATTEDGDEGDCEVGVQGSKALTVEQASSWSTAIEACVAGCLACSRCRYVSVALTWVGCRLGRIDRNTHHARQPSLRTQPANHLSLQAPAMHHASSCAERLFMVFTLPALNWIAQ